MIFITPDSTFACLFKMCTNDIGMYAFPFNIFLKIQFVFFCMLVAEYNIVSFSYAFRIKIFRQLSFAFLKIAVICKNLGFNNIFLTLTKDQDICSASSGRNFDEGLSTQTLNKEINKSIQRIMPRGFF